MKTEEFKELRKIKDIYGEEMMHLCRKLFPTVLEEKGKLLNILTNHIAPTRSFAGLVKGKYTDDFTGWILGIANNVNYEVIESNKTPTELLNQAGYNLYKCETNEDIESFKHYYATKETSPCHMNELLCTFNDPERIKTHLVFFAVKRNVDDIKRENFPNPLRQDAYGTSVISIQFSKGNTCVLSIKNRYNHAVSYADSTFSNNLENITPGLTNSFEKAYHIKIQKPNKKAEFLECIDYIPAHDGKYYHANVEYEDYFFCENNIIIHDGEIIDTYAKNKEKYLLIDQYLIDFQNKNIIIPFTNEEDSFLKSINSVGIIQKIETLKSGENRVIKITYKDGKIASIVINKSNSIIGYENNYVKSIDDNFLSINKNVSQVSLQSVLEIGNDFLNRNINVVEVNLDNVRIIGDGFMMKARRLRKIALPSLEVIGHRALEDAQLKEIEAPNLKQTGIQFLYYNTALESISFPMLTEMNVRFLCYNRTLNNIYIPKLRSISRGALAIDHELVERISSMINNNEPVIITNEEKTNSL